MSSSASRWREKRFAHCKWLGSANGLTVARNTPYVAANNVFVRLHQNALSLIFSPVRPLFVASSEADAVRDDIAGEKWNDFIKSYQTFGQLELYIVSQGNVIVSGHQRWRAAKETGVATVPCIYKVFDTDEGQEMALID